MSLTEKTFELNITHELLVLGQGMAAVFWSNRPRRAVSPPPSTPIYAAGLSLKQEFKEGWDVSLELPSVGATPAQVFFLQFKLGKFKSRTTNKNSMFASPASAPQHVLFEFNGNTGKNQHSRLRRTALAHGCARSAIYALPLITTTMEAKQRVGRMIAQTAFITVPAIDGVATPPVQDGVGRHVAIAADGSGRREVRSKPASVDEEIGSSLVAEVVAVRLHREMTAWRTAFSAIAPADAPPRRLGRLLVLSLVGFFAYFFGRPDDEMAKLFGVVSPRRRPQSAQSLNPEDSLIVEFIQAPLLLGEEGPFSGVVEDADATSEFEDLADRDRVAGIALLIAPLVKALLSGSWLKEVPPLPEIQFMFEVDGSRRASITMGDADDRRASRISYLVI